MRKIGMKNRNIIELADYNEPIVLKKAEELTKNEVNQMEPFWVGVLKGEAYPDNAGRGIIHRSPPMTIDSKIRILMKLDA